MGGFGVMVEYKLELVSQHPALLAQNPLLSLNQRMNIMNTTKGRFLEQLQTVAKKIGPENERSIKTKNKLESGRTTKVMSHSEGIIFDAP